MAGNKTKTVKKTTKKTNLKKTVKKVNHTTILLDRSGSMISCKNDMEGGIAELIKAQRDLDVDVSLYQFNNGFETIFENTKIKDCPEIVIRPSGLTALYDAIGKVGNILDQNYSKNKKKYNKKVFIIITDGEENASKEFNSLRVEILINKLEKDYGVEVVYLGANQDAFAAGHSIGLSSDKTSGFTVCRSQTMGASVGLKVASYFSGSTPDMNFTTSERASYGDTNDPNRYT